MIIFRFLFLKVKKIGFPRLFTCRHTPIYPWAQCNSEL